MALFMIDELCTRHPVELIHDAARQARRFLHQNRDRLRQHFHLGRSDNIIGLLESKLQCRQFPFQPIQLFPAHKGNLTSYDSALTGIEEISRLDSHLMSFQQGLQ